MKIILTILFIYFAVKILSRLFAPFLLKYVSKKAEQRFGQQFGGFKKPDPQRPEGEITIDKVPNQKSSNKSVGEYVDYEEID